MVSIHAPAWGATLGGVVEIPDQAVSIHAPAWGATSTKCGKSSKPAGFNPRTRVGCDNILIAKDLFLIRFNPRTRVGCDRQPCTGHTSVWMFQSTHPRGVRLFPCFIQ